MTRIHCAKGPRVCKICKEYAKDLKWALLDIAPEVNPMAARPMIELEVDGERVFLPFDVIAYYDEFKDAMEYINDKGIKVEIIDSE